MSFSRSTQGVVAGGMAALLAACASPPPMTLPGPIDFQRSPRPESGQIGGSTQSERPRPQQLTTGDLPLTPLPRPAVGTDTRVPPAPSAAQAGEDVSMAIEQTPLPMFIQILYGQVLKKAYSMDASVNARQDIVTFKTSQPIPRSRMEQVAANLLKSYGLTVQDFDGLVRIIPDNSPAASPPPVLRFGKTLPETPEPLRPMFQHVELDVVKTTEVIQWLRQILGNRVNIQEDTGRNGFLLAGTQADIRTALLLIQTLDQPRLRGRVAKRITPAFLNVTEFSTRLVDVMTAQGYSVSSGGGSNSSPILLIPIASIGSVMVFANNDAVMEQVLRWAQELDRPLSGQTQNGIYTYPVRYADAQELARTLGEILGGAPLAAPVGVATAATAGAGQQAQAAPAARTGGSRVVVNTATNTLIIRGTNADEYQQIMSLLRELDRPVKSALIEVVVAELRLGGSQALGIEWNVLPRAINSGQNIITGGTLGRLGIGSGGFTTAIANSAGQVLGQLNTLASNNQARILSNPKVLARNGETASINVGQEVPIVTSQQSSGTGNLFTNGGVLQTIQYRSTGVILRVRPVINSGNRLDLDVSQEVSSAAETRTGVSASPTISTRRIETKLSLRDGSTVLLGGLISRSTSDANTGIPYLKDIPGLGALFRTQSDSNDQTELLIMITPYVVSDDFESEAITEAIQKSFGDWAQDLRPARVMNRNAAPMAEPLPPAVAPAAPTAPAPATPTVSAPQAPDASSVTPPERPMPEGQATTPPEKSGPPTVPSAQAPDNLKSDNGITMSVPQAPAGQRPPASPGSAPADARRPDGTPVPAPATAPAGNPPKSPSEPELKPVTDPKLREELLRAIKTPPK